MAKKYYYDGKLYAAKDWDLVNKKPAPKKAKKVEEPVDGDKDGFVFDGTPEERPAAPTE